MAESFGYIRSLGLIEIAEGAVAIGGLQEVPPM